MSKVFLCPFLSREVSGHVQYVDTGAETGSEVAQPTCRCGLSP